ncbi:MAG: pitrilysin family protein [Mariniblastus sp.]|nr:pitrilysin family protein [Mariniblastus sp.]
MEYRQHKLENGLEILAECNREAYTSAFGFFVRTGSRDETHEVSGVSHFLEHMVFKGTPNRTAAQVNLELDEMGSSSNARTSEESTIYHAAVLPEFQTPVVELLSDIMRPSLRLEDFETEKQVIIEEIKMYDDQPPYGGYERVMAEYFGDHPLGQSVLGTVDTVTALTPDGMMNYFEQRYSPSNICFSAAGNIEFDELVEDIERCCGHWKKFNPERNKHKADYRNGFVNIHKPTAHQQYILQMAPGPSSEEDIRYATSVMSAIIGDDGGSRLYWEFLDSGLAESAGMGSYDYQGNGAIMTFLCCAPEQAQANLERLTALQSKIREQGITQKELDLAKRKIASHIVLASERTNSRMFSIGAQWLCEQPFKTVTEIAAIYEGLTLDQVNQALAAYPLEENMTVAVGPCDNMNSVA